MGNDPDCIKPRVTLSDPQLQPRPVRVGRPHCFEPLAAALLDASLHRSTVAPQVSCRLVQILDQKGECRQTGPLAHMPGNRSRRRRSPLQEIDNRPLPPAFIGKKRPAPANVVGVQSERRPVLPDRRFGKAENREPETLTIERFCLAQIGGVQIGVREIGGSHTVSLGSGDRVVVGSAGRVNLN